MVQQAWNIWLQHITPPPEIPENSNTFHNRNQLNFASKAVLFYWWSGNSGIRRFPMFLNVEASTRCLKSSQTCQKASWSFQEAWRLKCCSLNNCQLTDLSIHNHNTSPWTWQIGIATTDKGAQYSQSTLLTNSKVLMSLPPNPKEEVAVMQFA